MQPLPLPYTYSGLLPNNNPYAQAGLEQDFFSPAFCAQLEFTGCGYLSSWFPGGVRFPFEEDVATVAQQQYGAYLQDTIEMSDRWKAEAGVRLDGYNFQIPTQAGAPASIPAAEHQRLYEPHLRRVVLARPARYDSHRLRPHALDAVAELAWRRRQPRALRSV